MPAKGKTIHGHRTGSGKSPEYKTWLGMKERCYRVKHKDYPRWGGKGIRVCERWLHSFANFLDDMGPKPGPEYSIDRLNPALDYGPDNCRWATPQQQGAENKSDLIPVEVAGIQFPSIAAACRHFGILQTTVNNRMKAGIPVAEAFFVGRLKARRTRESYLRKDRR